MAVAAGRVYALGCLDYGSGNHTIWRSRSGEPWSQMSGLATSISASFFAGISVMVSNAAGQTFYVPDSTGNSDPWQPTLPTSWIELANDNVPAHNVSIFQTSAWASQFDSGGVEGRGGQWITGGTSNASGFLLFFRMQPDATSGGAGEGWTAFPDARATKIVTTGSGRPWAINADHLVFAQNTSTLLFEPTATGGLALDIAGGFSNNGHGEISVIGTDNRMYTWFGTQFYPDNGWGVRVAKDKVGYDYVIDASGLIWQSNN